MLVGDFRTGPFADQNEPFSFRKSPSLDRASYNAPNGGRSGTA